MPENIILGETLTQEKRSDKFLEVIFKYPNKGDWHGCLPVFIENMGIDLNELSIKQSIDEYYENLNPDNIPEWIVNSDRKWRKKGSETYVVLKSLYEGKWICRNCGSGNHNSQRAARIAVLRNTFNYLIASKRTICNSAKCKNKKLMHDILIMLPDEFINCLELGDKRKPISNTLKNRIIAILNKRDVFFNITRDIKQLVIDHKFPSQRWRDPETDNPDDMADHEIRSKFQLLTNQSNMLKSRICDKCVSSGKRGDFLGIKWYFEGDHEWRGRDKFDPAGCQGCPWFDLEKWKRKLEQKKS